MHFSNSESYLKRALEIIPNGTQTFSKSRTQYPIGMAPLYIQRAKGSHVWDVDGNEFIDFVSGLGSIILGYCDPDVDNAVKEQMEQGSIFSLPHSLEIEVAEMLIDMIPCAEMVRFGKNGSDVTSGAVRLARYVTGRDHVLVCAGHYHGWQDWFNGSTPRNGGVPEAVKALTHTFKYNDLSSLYLALREWPLTACVVMEPMTSIAPNPGFLEEVKETCKRHGTFLVFDEMLTGLRFPGLSAQKYFDVIPDLACFGKSIANGYPLSAIVGKADIMRKMEDVHFSFTFGGDCIALAAAKATLKKYDPDKMELFTHDRLKGMAMRPKWDFSDLPSGSREKIFQECYQNGILMLDYLNPTMSHTVEDWVKMLEVVEKSIQNLDRIELKGERMQSSFQVRA